LEKKEAGRREKIEADIERAKEDKLEIKRRPEVKDM
jgi:hypothetical protein